MRLSHYLRYGFVAFYVSAIASAHVHRIRADSSITATSDATSSASLSTSASGSFTPTSSGQASSSTVASSSVITSKDSTTISTPSSSTLNATAAALPTDTSNQTSSNDANGSLPIQPTITLAIGVAGAVMIISGLVYCLIGIKNKALYNFLSTAYLVSLAVTVLIIYVMNPPVSNAVQGAYLVAVAITGLIFGALALVFSEITDGLGCALGGFCLGMWFLTLVDGGLIKSKAGKAIVLVSFTVGFFVVSIFRYTRTYGLIACISFAGGTIVILGVDCFSRVGLKEFWIYIWDLNDDEFPLNTNTYVINRGMRVETAAIIAFFLLGVVSQLKLWKIIKKRQERRESERYKEQQSREKQDSEIGRRMMDNVTKDQARWISLYDHQKTGSTTDGKTSNDSVTKRSASVSERPSSGEDLEMSDLNSLRELRDLDVEATKGNANSYVYVQAMRATDGDQIQRIDSSGNPIDCHTTSGGHPGGLEPPIASTTSVASAPSSARQSLLPTPDVIPLPFTIPMDVDEVRKDADSIMRSPTGSIIRTMGSKRKSAVSTLKRLSLRSLTNAGPSQEELVASPDNDDDEDDDGSSSIAATIDILDVDDLSPEMLSEPRSPLEPNFGSQQSQLSLDIRVGSLSDEIEKANESAGQGPESEQMRKEDDSCGKSIVDSVRLSIVSDEDEECLKPTVTGYEDVESSNPTSNLKSQDAPLERRNSHMSAAAKSEVSPESLASLRINLSELPKNLVIYRTNEWAKHAAEADVPQGDEILRPDSPGVQVQHEKPQHVSQRLPVVESSTVSAVHQSSGVQPSAIHEVRSSSSPQISRPQSAVTISHGGTQQLEQQPFSQNDSTTTLSREPSIQNRTNLQSARNFSTPVLSTAVSEEFGEGVARQHRRQDTDVLTPLPSDTLLDKRNSRLKQRLSTTSFNGKGFASTPNIPTYAFSSTPNLTSHMPPSSPFTPDDSVSVGNGQPDDTGMDPDDVPLAERRAQLQRQSSGSSTSLSQAAWQLPHKHKSMNSLPLQQQTRLSRSSSGVSQRTKRASQYRTWRESIKDEFAREKLIADETGRVAMWEAKRKEEAMKLLAEVEKRNRDMVLGRSMRTGAMVNRHNELLRRMQAQANVKEG